MKRILSGIKPTGEPTLGNYLGAMKRWGSLSSQPGHEYFWFVPDLHALTVRPKPEDLRRNARGAVAWLIACGADTEQSIIFAQSQVPAHAELAWVLNNYTTVGELSRMTQFKDKAQKQGPEGQLVGLYDYPVLMAADILLYDADEIPVGDDQKQHVELTRDIATRFNNVHGETFRVPQPTVQKEGARIMDLQDPTKKMSKSDEDVSGCILLTDDESTTERKIMRAVTDSGSQVAGGEDKPALTNLLVISSLVSGKSVAQLEQDYAGRGYGDFKRDLATAVNDELRPVRLSFAELTREGNERIDEVLRRGRERAREAAQLKLTEVYRRVGLVSSYL